MRAPIRPSARGPDLASWRPDERSHMTDPVRFPPGFEWGVATAAYQIEGAVQEDGRGVSIWDVFCRQPGKVARGQSGDVACDHYHRYPLDVALMERLGIQTYRFSVAWPRVLPFGQGQVNDKGLDFYDRLVDALCREQIEPMLTLYHWDLPEALQSQLGGWLHADMPMIFADYAAVLFDRLGDRVRLWLTINEPWVLTDAGYFHGTFPPGISDRAQGYRAAHNMLRAHAYAVAAYRKSRHSNGRISFALNTTYTYPHRATPEDLAAAERSMLNFAGWFGDPCHFGEYPSVMRERLGSLLPTFAVEDAALLRRSMDFLALNYYFSDVARHVDGAGPMELELVPQTHLPRTEMNWPIMPDGLHRLLHWLWGRYELPVYITENGAAMPDRADPNGYVEDADRIDYLRQHIDATLRAQREGVDVRGYFVWSLMDNLEWTEGFSKRFGIVHCDRTTLARTIKASGHWYANFVRAQRQSAQAARVGTT
jgi:beta-glucosidase